MDPFDPLDQLMRGRASLPLTDRLRSLWTERRGLVIAGGLGVAVAVLVVAGLAGLLHAPSSAPTSLPRASTESSSIMAGGSTSSILGGAGAGSTSTAPTDVVVHVAGAVAKPGLVRLPPGSRVADAIAAAGGLRGDADTDRLNLAAPLSDGTRVFVAAIGQPDPAAPPTVAGPAAPGTAAAGDDPAAPVDINTADVDALDTLPGVGPSTAAAIVAYREAHGPFRSVDDLQDVRGIGPAKFEALAGLVVVGP